MNSQSADSAVLDLKPVLLRMAWKCEFVRFLVAGGIAASANLAGAGGYRLLLHATPGCFEASVAFGFSLGTLLSFVLNKFVTFRANSGNTWAQLGLFLLISVVSIAMSTLVAHLLFRCLTACPGLASNPHLAEALAHALTIGVMVVVNYAMMRHIAFRSQCSSPRPRLSAENCGGVE
jgi:putative flippase GtrA